MDRSTVFAVDGPYGSRRADPALRRPDIAIADLCCAGVLFEEFEDEGWDLFDQLRGLPQLSVNTWCAHNGMDRFRFARLVNRLLGITPSPLMRCYLATTVGILHVKGYTYAELAPVFGYAEASSLHRALRRHALVCPGGRGL